MKKRIARFTKIELIVIIVSSILLLTIIGVGCSEKKKRSRRSSNSSSESSRWGSGPAASAREKARQLNCQNNLKQIGMAIKSYSINENINPIWHEDGKNQGTKSLSLLISSGELTDYKVFVCPSSTTAAGTAPFDMQSVNACANALSGHVSYAYIPGIDTSAGSASGIAADGYYKKEEPNHKNYGNILFGDGSVRGCTGTSSKNWIQDAYWLMAAPGVHSDWLNRDPKKQYGVLIR